MNPLTERLRTHAREHPSREDILAPYERLKTPVPGEDDVSRFCRLQGCTSLGFWIGEEDFKFVKSIAQLSAARRTRNRISKF